MKKMKVLIALFAVALIAAALIAQPILQPGDLGITGKLKSKYLDENGNPGKIMDWANLDNIPDGQELNKVTRSLSDTEINQLHNVDIRLVSAPGAGKALIPVVCLLKLTGTESVIPTRKTKLDLTWGNPSDAMWGESDLLHLIANGDDWTLLERSGSYNKIVANKALDLSSDQVLPDAINGGSIIVYYREVSL